MTVKELMKVLRDLPGDTEVFVFDHRYGWCSADHVAVEKDGDEFMVTLEG